MATDVLPRTETPGFRLLREPALPGVASTILSLLSLKQHEPDLLLPSHGEPITDPIAVGGRTDRATIQGDARVIEEDPHGGWERLLPIWEKKEPSIVYFLTQRVALPLFFERSLIEITPRRVMKIIESTNDPRSEYYDLMRRESIPAEDLYG